MAKVVYKDKGITVSKVILKHVITRASEFPTAHHMNASLGAALNAVGKNKENLWDYRVERVDATHTSVVMYFD